jgi:hypothetical protein
MIFAVATPETGPSSTTTRGLPSPAADCYPNQ